MGHSLSCSRADSGDSDSEQNSSGLLSRCAHRTDWASSSERRAPLKTRASGGEATRTQAQTQAPQGPAAPRRGPSRRRRAAPRRGQVPGRVGRRESRPGPGPKQWRRHSTSLDAATIGTRLGPASAHVRCHSPPATPRRGRCQLLSLKINLKRRHCDGLFTGLAGGASCSCRPPRPRGGVFSASGHICGRLARRSVLTGRPLPPSSARSVT